MDCDDISVLYAKIMSDNPVDAGASIIEFIIGQHNQNRLLALLASNKDCVASEQSEDVHGIIGERDRGVVIVNGIGNTRRRGISVIQVVQ
jgi:hypothetical protein